MRTPRASSCPDFDFPMAIELFRMVALGKSISFDAIKVGADAG